MKWRGFSRTSFSVLLVLLLSCKHDATGPDTEGFAILEPTNFGSISLRLLDYDTLSVTHRDGSHLLTSIVLRIEIGAKSDSGFQQFFQYASLYDASLEAYSVHYSFAVAINPLLIVQPVTIRYHLVDSSYSDVDTSIALYSYPYPSSQVYADSTTIGFSFQDIARTERQLFFHGWSEGLHEYDLFTGQIKRNIYGYILGTHITANSSYVFCDVDHKKVVRFNLQTRSADLTITDFPDVAALDGIAIQDSSLYVIVNTFPRYLKRFTFDGVQLDSITYPGHSHFMAMTDSVIYSKAYDVLYPQLSRFDLKTMSFLPNVLSPALHIFGIEIYRDTLFYCDAGKGFVGAVPVSDLREAQQ